MSVSVKRYGMFHSSRGEVKERQLLHNYLRACGTDTCIIDQYVELTIGQTTLKVGDQAMNGFRRCNIEFNNFNVFVGRRLCGFGRIANSSKNMVTAADKLTSERITDASLAAAGDESCRSGHPEAESVGILNSSGKENGIFLGRILSLLHVPIHKVIIISSRSEIFPERVAFPPG